MESDVSLDKLSSPAFHSLHHITHPSYSFPVSILELWSHMILDWEVPYPQTSYPKIANIIPFPYVLLPPTHLKGPRYKHASCPLSNLQSLTLTILLGSPPRGRFR